jgi:hypothetical protein
MTRCYNKAWRRRLPQLLSRNSATNRPASSIFSTQPVSISSRRSPYPENVIVLATNRIQEVSHKLSTATYLLTEQTECGVTTQDNYTGTLFAPRTKQGKETSSASRASMEQWHLQQVCVRIQLPLGPSPRPGSRAAVATHQLYNSLLRPTVTRPCSPIVNRRLQTSLKPPLDFFCHLLLSTFFLNHTSSICRRNAGCYEHITCDLASSIGFCALQLLNHDRWGRPARCNLRVASSKYHVLIVTPLMSCDRRLPDVNFARTNPIVTYPEEIVQHWMLGLSRTRVGHHEMNKVFCV